MGKATIVSGGTDGLYTVKLDYGKATQTAQLAKMATRLAELVALVAEAQTKLDEKKLAEAVLKTAIEGYINAYVAAAQAISAALSELIAAETYDQAVQASHTSTPEDRAAASAAVTAAKAALQAAEDALKQALKDYTDTAVKLAEAARKIAPLRLALQLLKDEQAQLKRDQAYWTGLVLEETKEVWCADLTEGVTGLVATLEIPGENKLVLIAPEAQTPTPADGLLTAREVQAPGQVFFNAAILPGWQKYKPTFRRGTITAIDVDANTADVKLEAGDTSSAQGLGINQTSTLSAVPVTYMTCNANAFQVGDRCVIKFIDQSWAKPVVIGFVDNPRFCPFDLYYTYPDTAGSLMSLHTQHIRVKEDIQSVTAPSEYGTGPDAQAWWGWDDGVTTLTRHDTTARYPIQVRAQYLSMHKLALVTQTFDSAGTTVGLELRPISSSGTFAPFGYYAHERLTATFGTHAEALDWRPSPVEVHRWVPELYRTFVMTYTYNAGIERWDPPVDFAAGSFSGRDYPPWPPP